MTTEKEKEKESPTMTKAEATPPLQPKTPPVSPAPAKEEVSFVPVSDQVVRAHVGNPAKHVGTITKAGESSTFLPTIHEFITLSQMKEIVAEMEKK